ncbi:radical SAM protein [Curvibacter sp. APW13]|uniref:radical SAM protein n=1 Tax=Curvibacter sp. APW13 TaxID=3077236 RepID=UPI0039656C89
MTTTTQRAYHQLEITTRCNFDCWYCAGRNMPQQDMPWVRFTSIVDAIACPGSTVSLQGEGEPSLHPRFWDMVRYVRAKGHLPYTIVNGSRINAAAIARHFSTIGISIDTLDAQLANQTGRYNLPKVLENLDRLCNAMAPGRIIIMTVDLGQPLQDLCAWVKRRGFRRHVVQALNAKHDYAQRYPQLARNSAHDNSPKVCHFAEQHTLRYHTWQGKELPCVYIKDTTGFTTIAALRASLHAGHVPPGCLGCQHLRPKAPPPGQEPTPPTAASVAPSPPRLAIVARPKWNGRSTTGGLTPSSVDNEMRDDTAKHKQP